MRYPVSPLKSRKVLENRFAGAYIFRGKPSKEHNSKERGHPLQEQRTKSIGSRLALYLYIGLAYVLWENFAAALMGNYAFEIRRTFWGWVYYPVLFLGFGFLVEIITAFLSRLFPFQRWSGQRYVWLVCLVAAFAWGDITRQLLMHLFDIGSGKRSYAFNLLFLAIIPAAGLAVNRYYALKEKRGKLPDQSKLVFAFLAVTAYIIISNKVTYRYFQYDILSIRNLLLQPVFILVAASVAFIITRMLRSGRSLLGGLLILPLVLSIIVVVSVKMFSGTPRKVPQNSAGKPNIVILLFDALRGDHVGPDAQGNTLTPTMDSLAAVGRRYETAYSTTCWTFPAVSSMLTSRLPNKTGLYRRVYLPDDLTTLPGLLKQQGYYTACLTANGFISQLFGFDQLYDHLDFVRGSGPKQMFLPFRSFFPSPKWLDEVAYQFGFISTDLYSGDWREMNARAVKLLEEAPKQPLFLYMHYIEPHSPYFAKPFDRGLVDLEQIKRVFYQPKIVRQKIKGMALKEGTDLYEYGMKLVQTSHERYKGGVRETDKAVAQMLTILRQTGLDENTIVMIIADHGDGFMEHGRTGHGHSLYEEQVRIPLIFYIPPSLNLELADQPGGATILDVAPTLLELAGVPGGIPESDGWSLMHTYPDTIRRKFLVLENDIRTEWWEAVVSEPYKLILVEDRRRGTVDTLLFNLDDDPEETVNLYPQEKAIVDSLAVYLNQEMEQTVPPPEVRSEKLSPQEQERLRALGYVN